jgi:hypothetical protein
MQTKHDCECTCCGAKLTATVDDNETITWEGSHAENCAGAIALRTDPIVEAHRKDVLVRHMVNRFLGWRLPKPWHPDNGISYVRPNYAHFEAEHDWPTGTNLFDATQAEAMVRYMLAGMAEQPK